MAAQRFAPDLTPRRLGRAHLALQPPARARLRRTPQTPVGIVAASSATMAWREGGKVKVQRFTAGGDRLWLRPGAP